METRHILAALSYFSIFFAGIIVPLVIWLITDDRYVKKHALQALFSHILPYSFLIFAAVVFFTGQFLLSIGLILFFAVIILAIAAYNVVMGVRVLMDARRYS